MSDNRNLGIIILSGSYDEKLHNLSISINVKMLKNFMFQYGSIELIIQRPMPEVILSNQTHGLYRMNCSGF